MVTVFYGNQVFAIYDSWQTYQAAHANEEVPEEIWLNAIVHDDALPEWMSWWGFSDGVPLKDNEVPAVYKAWLLIL